VILYVLSGFKKGEAESEIRVRSAEEATGGKVLIRIESKGVTYTGRGAATDVIVASAKAYMNALNRLLAAKKGGK